MLYPCYDYRHHDNAKTTHCSRTRKKTEETGKTQVYPCSADRTRFGCCLLVFAWSTFHNFKTTQVLVEFRLTTESTPTSCEAPLSSDNISYALVTQLSQDRIWMMEYHCQRWTQNMSIAILSQQTHQQVMDGLVELGCAREIK